MIAVIVSHPNWPRSVIFRILKPEAERLLLETHVDTQQCAIHTLHADGPLWYVLKGIFVGELRRFGIQGEFQGKQEGQAGQFHLKYRVLACWDGSEGDNEAVCQCGLSWRASSSFDATHELSFAFLLCTNVLN